MNANLRIDSYDTSLERVQVTLDGLGADTDSGYRITFENATLGSSPKTKECSADGGLSNYDYRDAIFVLPGTNKVTAVLDFSDIRARNHNHFVVFANIEKKVKDRYKLVGLAQTILGVPKVLANNLDLHNISVTPHFINFGESFTVSIDGKALSVLWLSINDNTYRIHLDSDGKGSITLNSSEVTTSNTVLQQLRLFVSGEDQREYLTDIAVNILPEGATGLATASSSVLETTIQVLNPEEIDNLRYPSSGVGETPNVTAKKVTTAGDIAATTVGTGDFARIQSFSACKVAPGYGLVALSSQNSTHLSDTGVTDSIELAQIKASRVYCLLTPMTTRYSDQYRRARVVSIDVALGDCDGGLTGIEVDADIWDDTSLTTVWVLDGDMKGHRFKIMSHWRDTDRIWYLSPDGDFDIDFHVGDCFAFVPYGITFTANYSSLTNISPLPFITVDDVPVSALNPQIATNEAQSADATNQYVYVVAEGNVNGLAQLFFYGFNLLTGDIYGWKRLTWDGENKNARIHVDSTNNLHIVWESSRCQPGQILYGVLGPKSRGIINETFVSAVDKQAALRYLKTQTTRDSSDLDSPLVTISPPQPLELREVDEYGVPYGDMWYEFIYNSGSYTGTDDGTFSVAGNAVSDKFAAFAHLRRDQNGDLLDMSFSQLSYEIAFTCNLDISQITTAYSDDEINDLYAEWKSDYTPVLTGMSNINAYTGVNSNRFSIGPAQSLYDKIIPLVGSYKNSTVDGEQLEQLQLRHFVLALVPERVRFLATNIESSAQYVDRGLSGGNYVASQQQEYYTGKFRLALFVETSANLSDNRLGEQHYHILRLFGDRMSLLDSHNYRVAVHYGKLRTAHVNYRSVTDTMDAQEQDVRFSGDIIVAVDGKVQGAESFVPDFSDAYSQFDIGFGCAMVGEYRPFNIKPYDGTLNLNVDVTMDFSNVSIGPHKMLANTNLTRFSLSDRNVSKIYVASAVDETESMDIWEEIYGLASTDSAYLLNLGLTRGKIRLSETPITFEGRCSAPSTVLDKQDRLHIVYQSNRDGNWDVYYTSNSDPSLPFRFDTRITRSNGDSLMPTISIDDSGRRLIVWHDNRTGTYQLYAARSTTLFPDDGACIRSRIKDEYGLDDTEYGNETIYSEYEYIEDFGKVCGLSFQFENQTGTTTTFHFLAQFFYDENRTSLANYIDSELSNQNWYVRINGVKVPFPYNGLQLDDGDVVEIFYDISKEDQLSDSVYYVTVSYQLDDEITDWRTVKFFCPIGQLPLCNVPVLYENTTESTETGVHFNVVVYSDNPDDNDNATTVLSAYSNLDQRKWRSGELEYPSVGLSIPAGETVSLSFDPNILPLELSLWQNGTTIDSLLCNTRYYVKVFKVGDGTPIDAFYLECSCADVKANIWRRDEVSKDWICSGQGSSDIRLTDGDRPSLYPNTVASQDGIFYIVWEDLRGTDETGEHQPAIYFTVWDGSTDKFYSRSQGYFDQNLATNGFFKPLVILNNLQQPVFFYTNGSGLFRQTYSLYVAPEAATAASTSQYDDFIFQNNLLALQEEDFASCIGLDVYENDVVRYYHEDSDTPIALVDSCKVRFEVRCPHGTYAARFKNEDTDDFSEWIPVLPKLYNQSSSTSGVIPLETYLQVFGISDDRFIAEWVLSPGNGNKTVTCELMTYFGKTPTFSRNVVARYQQLTYTIEFFTSGTSVKASMYNGYPVISTKSLEVIRGSVGSIQSSTSDTSEITIRVSFDDPGYLDELLNLTKVSRFGDGSDPELTFNVIMPGKVLRNLTLTKADDIAVEFDYDNPPADASKVISGVYTGTFPIEKADGFENQDGNAVIILNIPSPCTPEPDETIPCDNNRETPETVMAEIASQVAAIPVDLERFRYAYNPQLRCSFLTTSCVNDTEPTDPTSIYEDDATFPPEFPGPVSCELVSWSSPVKAEPCFYYRDELNFHSWIYESNLIELDFSDSRIDYLKFGTSSVLDDILIMVKPNETITFTPAVSSPCPDPNSSSSSTDGTYGRLVTFSVPSGSIVFSHTVDSQVIYYCHGPSECNFGSARKIFNVSSTALCTIPEGSYTNNKTDGGATWSIPAAIGKLYDPESPPSQTHTTNCLLAGFENGVARAELEARGFITANGLLRFKFIHIPSGIGYADINAMTCGASCDE